MEAITDVLRLAALALTAAANLAALVLHLTRLARERREKRP